MVAKHKIPTFIRAFFLGKYLINRMIFLKKVFPPSRLVHVLDVSFFVILVFVFYSLIFNFLLIKKFSYT